MRISSSLAVFLLRSPCNFCSRQLLKQRVMNVHGLNPSVVQPLDFQSYCYSGYSCIPPSPRIPPGVTERCQFANVMLSFWGSVGVPVYEADTFTLAILFSNPFAYNIFYVEVALEISMENAHHGSLEEVYKRMYNSLSTGNVNNTTFQQAKVRQCQETLTVYANHVQVTATMSNAAKSVIKVIVEDKDGPPAYSEEAPPGSHRQYLGQRSGRTC
nr:uncharacterized protein LOC112995593 [Dromaius novaehollandiae]